MLLRNISLLDRRYHYEGLCMRKAEQHSRAADCYTRQIYNFPRKMDCKNLCIDMCLKFKKVLYIVYISLRPTKNLMYPFLHISTLYVILLPSLALSTSVIERSRITPNTMFRTKYIFFSPSILIRLASQTPPQHFVE